MSAVATANPLNTDMPTCAEWSAEKVIMTAASAAKRARPICRWRSSKARGAASDTGVVLTDGNGMPPV